MKQSTQPRFGGGQVGGCKGGSLEDSSDVKEEVAGHQLSAMQGGFSFHSELTMSVDKDDLKEHNLQADVREEWVATKTTKTIGDQLRSLVSSL